MNLCCAEKSLIPSIQSAPLLQRCSVVCKTAFLQSLCMDRSFAINLWFSSKFSLVKVQYMHHHTELCVPVAVVALSVHSCTGMRCSHAKQLLFVSDRMAPMRRQSCGSSSSWLGPTTGCPNTPPQSSLSCGGSRPVTQQMLGPWLCTAGRTVCLPAGCRSFNLSESGVSPSCEKGFMVA